MPDFQRIINEINALEGEISYCNSMIWDLNVAKIQAQNRLTELKSLLVRKTKPIVVIRDENNKKKYEIKAVMSNDEVDDLLNNL